jgi:hypothetical protein
LDSLFKKINSNDVSNEDYYYYLRNLALRSTFESSRIGFDQIKSAGGLRMIESKEIITGIQEYERKLNSIEKLENVRERTLEQGRFKMAQLFNANVLYEMTIGQSADGIMRFRRPEKADDLMNAKKDALNEVLNLTSIGLNTNRYLNQLLISLNVTGRKLDSAILNQYQDKMH